MLCAREPTVAAVAAGRKGRRARLGRPSFTNPGDQMMWIPRYSYTHTILLCCSTGGACLACVCVVKTTKLPAAEVCICYYLCTCIRVAEGIGGEWMVFEGSPRVAAGYAIALRCPRQLAAIDPMVSTKVCQPLGQDEWMHVFQRNLKLERSFSNSLGTEYALSQGSSILPDNLRNPPPQASKNTVSAAGARQTVRP